MTFKHWIKKSLILGMSVSLLAPSFSHAYGESSVIQGYLARQSLVPLIKAPWGNFILHQDSLNKLYSQRSYQAIWVDSSGRPNSMAQGLKSLLLKVERHGLFSEDYWDVEVENLFKAANANQKNWITFELAASEALIRYVTHLSVGRFDPDSIDSDIKFKRKSFNEFAELNAVLASGSSSLASGLDRFAPKHPRYKDMMQMLAQLREIKAVGGWNAIVSPGIQLKKGVANPAVTQLRTRLNQLGYRVSNAGGDLFDAELDQVVRQFQTKNGLDVDGVIGTRSEVLRSLNFSVNQRIVQVEVNMEKLRWLPRDLESRHVFVNLAMTEFNLFDGDQRPFHFKTINGQSFRRTPSMRDEIKFVELNPTWTVPHSIAVKDKLSELKKNPGYLKKNNMKLLDASSDSVVDPYSVDWSKVSSRNFSYYIRQEPGRNNALGVVKFPLTNPWAIYLHDTNDHNLFEENKRHLSSGCVRLEYALDFAAYILADNVVRDKVTGEDYWPLEKIKSVVPEQQGEVANEADFQKKLYLKQPVPVYFLYLTVDRAEDGALRFVDDVYGQDTRVAKALQNKKIGGELF